MKTFTTALLPALLLLLPSAKTHAQPTWQWATAAGAGANSNSHIQTVVLDGADNTIVAGTFYGTLTLGSFTLSGSSAAPTLFVAWLNSNGQWAQAVQATSSTSTYGYALAASADGSITVAGSFSGSTTFGNTTLTSVGYSDVFVARLSSRGQWTQAVQAGGPDFDTATALALDGAGNATVVGRFGPSIGFGGLTLSGTSPNTGFVARLSAGGTWTQAVAAAATGNVDIAGLALDATGTATVAGTFNGTLALGSTTLTSAAGSDIFVARLSPQGQWTQAVRAGGGGTDEASGLAMDAQGNVAITGSYINSFPVFGGTTLVNAGYHDRFVARLSRAGQWTQAVRLEGLRYQANIGTPLLLDAAGTITLIGDFSGTTAFGPFTLTNTGNPAYTHDSFVAQLNAAGSWTQVVQGGGTGDDRAFGIATDNRGQTVLVGLFRNNTQFGTTAPLTSANPSSTGYVASLAGFVTATAAPSPAARFTLAPNPATGFTRLIFPAATATPRPVQLLDGLGRQVRRLTLPAHATTAPLDVAGLAPGLYVVRCAGAAGRLVVE